MKSGSEQDFILGLLIFFFLNTKQNLAAKFRLGDLQSQLSLSSVYAL